MFEQSHHKGEPHEDDLVRGFKLLNEEDIPGALLNGKTPRELNVHQLKCWSSYHGAPVSGKKPELIERLAFINIMICVYMCNITVECYIKYDWHQFIVDPDKGIHSHQKLTTAVHRPGTKSYNLLQSFPSQKDVEWTKQLYMLPTTYYI